jgi:hypothetical protein
MTASIYKRAVLAAFLWVAGAACSARAAEDFSTLRGANYVPSYARNAVAIWMDFDPAVIDRELGYARRLNLNSVRVFLQQAVYEKRPQRFLADFETFLALCDKHQIRMMPVLFDSCFDPQIVDFKDYRDKTWMPSPGFGRLGTEDRPAMEDYIRAVVGSHKADRRVVIWDVMNEPVSTKHFKDPELAWNQGGYQTIGEFVRWALQRVRQERPVQPLTIGWNSWNLNILSIDLVDVISFHTYSADARLHEPIREAQLLGRLYAKPVVMSEFAGRPIQPIEKALPIVTERRLGWYFWELMIGRTQFAETGAPYQGHIYPDGTCRSAREVAAILHPGGYSGDPRAIAAQAGFRPRSFVDQGITFEGGWERWNGRGPTRGRLWRGGNLDDSATKTVRGTTISVVLKHAPDGGIATVAIDGKASPVGDIDTYAKDVDWNRHTVVARDLSAGSHTVVVTASGRKNDASKHRFVQLVDIIVQP